MYFARHHGTRPPSLAERTAWIFSIALTLAATGTGYAKILVVPSVAYPDLETALQNAVDHDEIHLRSGTFIGPGNRGLDFRGLDIIFRSQVNDPTLCIIDCEWDDRAMLFTSGEPSTTKIMGITIRRGEHPSPYRGGAVYIDNGSAPTFENCRFEQCLSQSGTQGGAAWATGGSTPTFDSCVFEDNNAEIGGAISATDSSSVSIADCDFTLNRSQSGGAIRIRDADLTVSLSTFFENEARSGGGLYIEGASTAVLSQVTIDENEATINFGGGVHCRDTSSLQVDSLSVIGNNHATTDGGGVHVTTTGSVAFDNTWFEFNTCDGNGAGVYTEGADATFTDCLWNTNMAVGNGGGLHAESGSAITIDDSNFVGNFADGGGGANIVDSTIECTLTDLTQCTADIMGGGLRNLRSTVTVTDCYFNGNRAFIAGGSIANLECDPTISDTTISNSLASDTFTTGSGGGMINIEADPDITNCLFELNRAESNGGAIDNQDSTPVISGCDFDNNDAGIVGGGAISNLRSDAMITGCRFTFNQIDPSGGAILNHASSPTITWCHFERNVSTQNGGAIFSVEHDGIPGAPVIEHCWFIDNEAKDTGGAISGGLGTHHTVTNCMFSRNVVTLGTGGAIAHYALIHDLDVTNCSFSRNDAGYKGGGIFADDGLTTNVFNSILYENTAVSSASTEREQVDWTGGSPQPVMEYCDIEGWTTFGGTGLFDTAPDFVDPALDDLRLLDTSPCLDSSDSTRIPAHVTVDLDILPRYYDEPSAPNNGVGPEWADLGAYEYQGVSTCLTLVVENLVAGQKARFTLNGGTPGEKAVTVWGPHAGQTTINNYAGYCAQFDIGGVNQSRVLGGLNRSFDAAGEITFQVSIPSGSQGLSPYFQSAMHGTCPGTCVSNLVQQTIL